MTAPAMAVSFVSFVSFVSLQTLQIGEGRIAGAEIINRQTNAEFANLFKHENHVLMHQCAFGNFETQRSAARPVAFSISDTCRGKLASTSWRADTLVDRCLPAHSVPKWFLSFLSSRTRELCCSCCEENLHLQTRSRTTCFLAAFSRLISIMSPTQQFHTSPSVTQPWRARVRGVPPNVFFSTFQSSLKIR